jgi:hypothetical protein
MVPAIQALLGFSNHGSTRPGGATSSSPSTENNAASWMREHRLLADSTGCQATLPIRLWTHNDLPARQWPAVRLEPDLYLTVLRRGVSRQLTPEPSRLGIGLTVIDRSRGRHGGGNKFQAGSYLLKVSGANETGGAKRGANNHRHQATSGHVQPQSLLADATPSHVQRQHELALQARCRRFEPCCAHCFSEPEMIVREPNGEPISLMILALAGRGEASRGTGPPHSSAS